MTLKPHAAAEYKKGAFELRTMRSVGRLEAWHLPRQNQRSVFVCTTYYVNTKIIDAGKCNWKSQWHILLPGQRAKSFKGKSTAGRRAHSGNALPRCCPLRPLSTSESCLESMLTLIHVHSLEIFHSLSQFHQFFFILGFFGCEFIGRSVIGTFCCGLMLLLKLSLWSLAKMLHENNFFEQISESAVGIEIQPERQRPCLMLEPLGIETSNFPSQWSQWPHSDEKNYLAPGFTRLCNWKVPLRLSQLCLWKHCGSFLQR